MLNKLFIVIMKICFEIPIMDKNIDTLVVLNLHMSRVTQKGLLA